MPRSPTFGTTPTSAPSSPSTRCRRASNGETVRRGRSRRSTGRCRRPASPTRRRGPDGRDRRAAGHARGLRSPSLGSRTQRVPRSLAISTPRNAAGTWALRMFTSREVPCGHPRGADQVGAAPPGVLLEPLPRLAGTRVTMFVANSARSGCRGRNPARARTVHRGDGRRGRHLIDFPQLRVGSPRNRRKGIRRMLPRRSRGSWVTSVVEAIS